MIENLYNKVISASGLDIDRKFKPWVKFIDKINYDKQDGYMFVGKFVTDRTIELDPKERLMLACAKYGSRKFASNYYQLCILHSSGDVEAVGEEFDDKDRGWALVVREEVERFLKSISIPQRDPTQEEKVSISSAVHERMADYAISHGENKISIAQFRDDRNMWGQPVVSSMIHVMCGGYSGIDPEEMIAELRAIILGVEDVLHALDKRMKEMGDEYEPPVYPKEGYSE